MAKITLNETDNGAVSRATINSNFTELYTTVSPASASAPASLDLHEDTDNGTNKITITAPSAVASDKVLTLPDATDTLVGKDTTDTLTNKTLSTGTVIGNNLVTANSLATNAITLGYTSVTTNKNITNVQSTLAQVTVTVPAGGRNIKITASVPYLTGAASETATWFKIVENGTDIAIKRLRTYLSVDNAVPTVTAFISAPSAGSHTYKFDAVNDTAVTTVAPGGATYPIFILVEAI